MRSPSAKDVLAHMINNSVFPSSKPGIVFLRTPVFLFGVTFLTCTCVAPLPDQSVATAEINEIHVEPTLEIKFRDDLEVRLYNGELRSRTGHDLSGVNALIRLHAVSDVQPLVIVDPDALAALERDAEARTGKRPPDLLSWYVIVLSPTVDLTNVVRDFEALPEVEYVRVAPRPMPPPLPSGEEIP